VLRQFELTDGPDSYKSKDDPSVRRGITERLTVRAPWLEMSPTDRDALHASDDCLDALMCALAARATALGITHPPDDPERARREGWIHVPRSADALKSLVA
jgi:hypothetical protein